MESKTKALIISLGGSPQAISYSIEQHQPEYICFVVSPQTKSDINNIIQSLTAKPKHYDWIETPDATDLVKSYEVIYNNVPNILKKWDVSSEELSVDYTGGTKVMSAALVLAMTEISNRFSYVSGKERNKGGVGTVVNGQEHILYQNNPWEVLAIPARKDISLLFNKARYQSAYELAQKIAVKVTSDQKVLFSSLADIIDGYSEWDRFNHNAALHKLNKGIRTFSTYADGTRSEWLRNLAQKIQNNIKILEQIRPNSLYLCYDLIANAKRRAELEHKYDDAVARLYRTLEALAQLTLQNDYKINASDVKVNQLPDGLKDKYKQKYCDANKIKLPSYASYELLNELGHELGKNFIDSYDEIRSLLNLRNDSILAHGFIAIKEENYHKLLETICKFAGINQSDLPVFPQMQL